MAVNRCFSLLTKTILIIPPLKMCLAEARHISVLAQSERDDTNTSVMRHKIRAGPAGKRPKKCVPPSENVHKDENHKEI